MVDGEILFGKVVSFYQSLPKELLEKSISDLALNREHRRKITKNKSILLKDKVRVLMNPKFREVFADSVYNTVKDSIPLDLNNSSYADIIEYMTDENKDYATIFFFRWCYEDGKDGSCNDDNYFEAFVNSELFDCIVKGESIADAKTLALNALKADPQPTEAQPTEAQPQDVTDDDARPTEQNENVSIDDTQEEVKTMKLLGRIEERNSYYNFFPQYELINGKFEEIPYNRRTADYPDYGGIALSTHSTHGSAKEFIGKISTDSDTDEYVKNAYVIEIKDSDFEKNFNDKYYWKIDLQKIVQEGRELHDMIRRVDDCGVYKVVESESDVISDTTFNNGNIILRGNNIIGGEWVVLYRNEKYYGPFKASQKDKFFINTLASEENYLVPYFSTGDVEVIELEKQKYNGSLKYTRYICTSLEKQRHEDTITDEMLLEKITDDVSLDAAKMNPEEFSHLYSNSPFLSGLPQDIISRRIDRLLEIIADVEKFRERKREVFNSLLKIYRDESSEVSDEMITESDTFKELQIRYNEERRKNEEADRKIQELNKAKEDLNEQLDSINKNPAGAVSSEEKDKLQAEIDKLKAELEKEKEINLVIENIETLKKERDRLKNYNEVLSDQFNEYKQKIKSAQSDVSKAIEEGASKMASLAFDPFISSEMMKKAASWDSKKEDDEYRDLQNRLLYVEPSELCGADLVDYVVKYVKEYRDYSSNDIINIYISIAQNFITIFSGEPGTGKTSICNIVAETLGLLNYGEKLNRFVSVSVERGWASKRDLIGYYNPLTRKYDKSNRKIYDALRMLDEERDESKYPFVIMLDEANLSPIEYYWADFMRLTDRTSQNDTFINIGAERELYVPETLRFIATINTDQTTEALSPRLIDRACIIKLPNAEPKQNVGKNAPPTQIITWDNFIDAFSKKVELHPITQKAIKEIYKLFNDYGMSVSPRIQLGIKNYVMAAQEIMEDESDALAREKALDFAIVQKLLPKINGYYSLYERFFDSMKQLCKEYNLYMTDEAISKIIDAQERNMGYCQYLI